MRRSIPKLRCGIGISFEEYNSRNIEMVRNYQAEALRIDGYIGYFDTWNNTLRVFVFDNRDEADRALRIAHSIGFESAGAVEGFLFISNRELQRPHLQDIHAKKQFYRELYR